MTVLTPSRLRPTAFGRNLGLALCGAALITLGAKVQIPFWPVPMTLHLLSLFFIALAFGPRLGTAAMLAYLGAGAMGIPVFSGSPERGLGLAYMVGPTGGYLLGFLLAVPVIGTLARGRGLWGRSLAMTAGLAVVYGCGLLWLAAFVPAPRLLGAGFTPFILGDLLKLALVALMFSGLDRLKGFDRLKGCDQ